MGKRSNFERKERDFYPSPYKAVLPLLPFLNKHTKFCELMAGDYRLANHLEKHNHTCVYACDIEPQDERVQKQDVLFFGLSIPECDAIITNPPWSRATLHDAIERFRQLADTWLLFDADWKHTEQAKPYLKYCDKVVNVGRISWEENGVAGKDNCCWYLFKKEKVEFTKYYNI